MRLRTWIVPVAALLLAADATAQRGGGGGMGGGGRRGPPEAIRTRLGSYFVAATLPQDVTAKGALAKCAHVEAAAAAGNLSLLYVYDPTVNEKKHERFEQALFGHQSVSVALKYFKAGRMNVANDDAARKAFGRKTPFFVAFDRKGQRVGEVSMRGYKASTKPLVALLTRASKGYSKVSLPVFVKKYGKFLGDLRKLEMDKSKLEAKGQRLAKKGAPPAAKAAKLEKERAALGKAEEKLLEREEKLLSQAKVPARDGNAERLGDRPRGRRR